MEAIKIELEGIATSFRYPFIMIGRQLSFPVPPPATIYGHICSALGYFIAPGKVQIAYSFQSAGVVDDLEILYIGTPGGSKIKGWDYPVALNCGEQPQPTQRQMLFAPRLVLYLMAEDNDQLFSALREPKYVVVLGRSQDLAAYRKVERVELCRSKRGYCDGSLLSLECRFRTTAGTVYRLPRFIDPHDQRKVSWGDYLYSPNLIFWGEGEPGPRHISLSKEDELWVDPTSEEINGNYRVVYWHTFVNQ